MAVVLANEHHFGHMNLAGALELGPALAGNVVGLAGVVIEFHFGDGEVRAEGPVLRRAEGLGGKLVMNGAEVGGGLLDLNVDGGSDGEEGGNIAEVDVERDETATGLLQELAGGGFRTAESAGREDGDVGGHVGRLGVEFPAKVFDELAYRIANVGHQSMAGDGHEYWVAIISEWDDGEMARKGSEGKRLRTGEMEARNGGLPDVVGAGSGYYVRW